MAKFNTKDDVFKYILEKYGSDAKVVLNRGSVSTEPIKSFSNLNIEAYGKKRYPIYEIHIVRGLPILISIYFYNYKFGSLIPKPLNVKMLKGSYTSGIEEVFEKEINTKDPYKGEEVMIRQNQLLMDFFFKFIRTGDEKYLEKVNKKLDFRSLPPRKEIKDDEFLEKD